MRIRTLPENLRCIKDPRRQWGHLRHRLEDILSIGLLTIICGGEDFTDMEGFGLERKDWLCTFLELPHGIPDSDTFRRVFEVINPQELSEHLQDWLALYREKRSIISIDGKTIRGSEGHGHKAYHVVSAFVSENRLTLGEIKTDEKSNEITAVPELLELLDIEGAIITADAMSCQTKIVSKIVEKKADYVISLKGNQSTLKEDAALYFSSCEKDCMGLQTLEKNHGRIEKRKYLLCTDVDWLAQRQDWAKLSAIGAVQSTVDQGGEVRLETRYFITSLTEISEFARAVRGHWAIENQLHWCLDVLFREDASRAKKDNSPLNLNVLRKVALPLLKAADFGRIGIRKKMLRSALSISSLELVLA